MKALPIILGVIIVGLVAVLILVPGRNRTNAPTSTSTTPGSTNTIGTPAVSTTTAEDRHGGADQATYYTYTSAKGKIVKASVAPNQKVIFAPTFTFTGNVPAGWAFEATFPVQVVDANGYEVARGQATVPNWTSPNGAWFSATVTGINKPDTATGFVVLKNDNPSGLPANADQVRIPIKF